MTHTPPVPKGNTSPYPLQEPPHPHEAPAPSDRPVARTPDRQDHSRAIAIGAAIGIGATALALAAGVYMLEERGKPKKGRKGGKHKAKAGHRPKSDHGRKTGASAKPAA